MRKILPLLLFTLLSFYSRGQLVNIPDANFKAALLNHVPVINTNGDGEIQVSEADAFTGALTVSSKNIADLTGIEAFTNMQALYCDNNNLTSLTIGNAPQLQILGCTRNKLTSLNLGNTPALTGLVCYNNKLTSLALGNLPSLKNLFCYANNLTSLSLGSANSLTSLDCHSNKLTKLSLSDYPSLGNIDCYNNDLDSITLSNLPAFSLLKCSINHLRSVTLNNLPVLPELDLSHNQLTSLTISSLPKLRILHVANNLLTSLSLSNLPILNYLACNDNLLTTLDLSQTAVKQLYCSNNPNLQYINIKNSVSQYILEASLLPALQSVCADENEMNFLNTTLAAQLPGQNIAISSFCNFNPGSNYNTIAGTLRFDRTNNGCDNLDSTMSNVKIRIDDGSQNGTTFTNMQGNYKFFVQQNSNIVTPELTNPYFTITPPSYTINFSGYGNTQVADFCISPNGIHKDLDITLLPITIARPGFDAQYRLVYSNKGNQVQSGSVHLSFDAAKLNFVSSAPGTTSETAGNLTWSFAELSPFETRTIILVLHVNAPPVVNVGDVLTFTAIIDPIEGDETPGDNTFNFSQVARGAVDPNDKDVTEGSATDISRINGYLHYIIRFQNTGNEPAISVVIKDLLADNLDWNSFVPISASHPYRALITKGNMAEFIFDGINLPGKIMNEPASHGYIAFKIKPKNGIIIGETIYNKAGIYFDYNQPVVTNTVSTTIVNFSKTRNAIGLTVYPNPAKDHIWFTVNEGVKVKSINLYNGMGVKLYAEDVVNCSTPKMLNMLNLPTGILFLEVISDQGNAIQKVIRTK